MREIFMYGSMRGERVVLNSTSLARLLYWSNLLVSFALHLWDKKEKTSFPTLPWVEGD